MIRPAELRIDLPVTFDGQATTTVEVWRMLEASAVGDMDCVRSLVARAPVLACCKYNYTPPIHLAVREGHRPLVELLIEKGGYPPAYASDPFRETLQSLAHAVGHTEIERVLTEAARDPEIAARCVAPGDNGRIDYGGDAARVRTERLITTAGNHRDDSRVRSQAMDDISGVFAEHPELPRDELFFWGEGILAVPANNNDREMVELLLDAGARVPAVSKWGDRYYFKHYDMAALLLEKGMSPNHMNWFCISLLHVMAWQGDLAKAKLLLDHGADVEAIDDEYGSTALGVAERRGHREIVSLLSSG